MDIVIIRKVKRPRGSGTWSGYRTATDVVGSWVFTPAHSTFYGHDGADRATCEVAQDSAGAGRHSIILLPAEGWFVACWTLGAEHLVSVDICTPPSRTGSLWTFDDLELDPYLTQHGIFGVEDEDEFEAACAARLISSTERAAALATVSWLARELADPDSTLVATGRRRLEAAVEHALPPLVDVDPLIED